MSEDDWRRRRERRSPDDPWIFPDLEEMMKEMETEMRFRDAEEPLLKSTEKEKRRGDGRLE